MYSKFVLDTTKKKAIDLLPKRSHYLTLPYQTIIITIISSWVFLQPII